MCPKRISACLVAVCVWASLGWAVPGVAAAEPGGPGRDGAWTELGEVEITTDTAWVEGQYRAQNLRVSGSATLTIAGGSTVEIAGALTVADTATVLCQGKNTAGQVDDAWAGAGVTLQAGGATVEAGARITGDAMGYAPTLGPGYGGNVWDNGSGGSYGGWGGRMGGSDAGGAPYGSIEEPTDLGSGGGWSTAGARAG